MNSERSRARALTMTLAALGLAAATEQGRGRALDDRLFRWLNGEADRPWLDNFFGAITELGSIYASSGAAAVIALRGRRREAADAIAAASVTWLAGQGLKKLWRRARPFESALGRLLIAKPRGTSWPSSHPMVLLAFLTVAADDLGLERRARMALTGLAGVVGASRIGLGVHYPADVAGGLLLGGAIGGAWSRFVSPRVLGR